MERDMRKNLFILAGLLLALHASFAQMRNDTSLTLAVTPTKKDENDHVSYDGAYSMIECVLSDERATLGGKLYYRLKEAKSSDEEAQKLDVKRAYAKVRPFGNSFLEIAIGKLYSYYLSGGYFSLTETYTGAVRWGETGVGAKTEFKGLTLGLALPVTESYVAFSKDWGLNAAASYNFAEISKNLPFIFGFDVLYSAGGDDDEDVNNVSEKDFSESVALNFSKRNFGIFSSFGFFLAFSHNVRPYVAHTVLSPVAEVSSSKSPLYAKVKKSNLFSFALRPTIGKVRVTSESEVGHAVDGNLIPFYSALQVYFPVYGIVALKPMAGFYAVFDTSDSSNSFRTWEFYPRIMLEFDKLTVTAGWDIFYKEMSRNHFYWIWTVPITAKIKIGG